MDKETLKTQYAEFTKKMRETYDIIDTLENEKLKAEALSDKTNLDQINRDLNSAKKSHEESVTDARNCLKSLKYITSENLGENPDENPNTFRTHAEVVKANEAKFKKNLEQVLKTKEDIEFAKRFSSVDEYIKTLQIEPNDREVEKNLIN